MKKMVAMNELEKVNGGMAHKKPATTVVRRPGPTVPWPDLPKPVTIPIPPRTTFDKGSLARR